MFDDVDAEAALHAARPGKQSLHRLLEAGTGAGQPDDGEVVSTAVELPVEHQERQATEVVAVQVADQHRLDLIGVDLLLAQRGQIGGPTVQQQAGRGRLVRGQGDAGLEPPPGAERIASAHRRHPHHTIIPCRPSTGKASRSQKRIGIRATGTAPVDRAACVSEPAQGGDWAVSCASISAWRTSKSMPASAMTLAARPLRSRNRPSKR